MKRLFVIFGACVLLTLASSFPVSGASAQERPTPFGERPFGERPFGERPFGEQPPTDVPRGDNELGVKITLSALQDGDSIGLTGLGAIPGGIDYYDELGRAVGDSLGISRSDSTVESFTAINQVGEGGFESELGPFGSALEEAFAYDAVVAVHDGRILERQGDQWVLRLETADLQRAARIWGFSGVGLSVCPVAVEVVDTSSRPPEGAEDGCRWWVFDAQGPAADDQPLTVVLTQQPDAGDYWSLVTVLADVTGLATVIFSIAALFLRRTFFPRLTTSTLLMTLLFTVLSVAGAIGASVVLAVADRPMIDIVLARDMGEGANFVAIVAPGFLFALPFLGPALVFALAKPVTVAPGSSSGATPSTDGVPAHPTGVPHWLGASPDPAKTNEPPRSESNPDERNESEDDAPPSWWSPPS